MTRLDLPLPTSSPRLVRAITIVTQFQKKTCINMWVCGRGAVTFTFVYFIHNRDRETERERRSTIRQLISSVCSIPPLPSPVPYSFPSPPMSSPPMSSSLLPSPDPILRVSSRPVLSPPHPTLSSCPAPSHPVLHTPSRSVPSYPVPVLRPQSTFSTSLYLTLPSLSSIYSTRYPRRRACLLACLPSKRASERAERSPSLYQVGN